jgi:serine/threonine protein kinase
MTDDGVPNLDTVASPSRQDLDYNTLESETDPLSTGGQGVVYEAHLSGSGPDRVAFKQPAEPGTISKDTVEQFLQEAETWAMLDQYEREKPRWAGSEHIVGIIDTGETLPWIAMEYMDGGSLSTRLGDKSSGLPVDETLWIGECICRGIELAHSYGIVHLDLKPENILFRETTGDSWNVPKIADWGLARDLSEQSDHESGLSVPYAAPEQFAPEEFGDRDMLTDVYQVGALMYEALTGRPPYVGSYASIRHAVVTGALEPPTSVSEAVSDVVSAAVETALETDKRNRYDAIQVFRQALHAVRTGDRPPRIVSQRLEDTAPTPHSSNVDKSGHPARNSNQRVGAANEREDQQAPDSTTTECETDVRRPDHERESDTGWFTPRTYPEAANRSLAVALITEPEPADTIATGIREISSTSLATRLEQLGNSE